MERIEIECRLVKLAVKVLEFTDSMKHNTNLRYILDQLKRCGTAPALIYGEVQHAESHKDFLHKVKVLLKELKETNICMKIISNFSNNNNATYFLLSESETFIRIFTTTATTIQTKIENERKK